MEATKPDISVIDKLKERRRVLTRGWNRLYLLHKTTGFKCDDLYLQEVKTRISELDYVLKLLENVEVKEMKGFDRMKYFFDVQNPFSIPAQN